MADRVVPCPWCYEPTVVDDRRYPMGDPRAGKHLKVCTVLSSPPQQDDAE